MPRFPTPRGGPPSLGARPGWQWVRGRGSGPEKGRGLTATTPRRPPGRVPGPTEVEPCSSWRRGVVAVHGFARRRACAGGVAGDRPAMPATGAADHVETLLAEAVRLADLALERALPAASV